MDKVKKTILMTGSTGFIGQRLLSFLNQKTEYQVVTITRNNIKVGNEKNFVLDLNDLKSLEKIVITTSPDIILNLAAVGVKDKSSNLENMFKINAFLSAHILDMCKNNGITPLFIAFSSGFEYQSSYSPLNENSLLMPETDYGISKLTQTLLLHKYKNNFQIILLRLFAVFGQGESKERFLPYIINQAIEGKKINLTGCEQVRDFMDVDDIAESILQVLKNSSNNNGLDIYNIGTGKEISLIDIVKEIEIELKKNSINPSFNIGKLPYRMGEPMYYVANIEKFNKRFGKMQSIPLSHTIRKMVKDAIDK